METFPADMTFLQFESKSNLIADQTIPYKTVNKPSKKAFKNNHTAIAVFLELKSTY